LPPRAKKPEKLIEGNKKKKGECCFQYKFASGVAGPTGLDPKKGAEPLAEESPAAKKPLENSRISEEVLNFW
jgi:hypothetical protein